MTKWFKSDRDWDDEKKCTSNKYSIVEKKGRNNVEHIYSVMDINRCNIFIVF